LEEVGLRLVPGRASKAEREGHRWLVVTVEGDPAQITPGGKLPTPLAELRSSVEVEVRSAPGSWDTEIFARPAFASASTVADRQLRGRLRSALRQTKQLLEVGEVLIAEPRPEGRRPATVAGKLVDHAERTADEKGVL
jgi:hypothetical protein